jgi:hypothetical protein
MQTVECRSGVTAACRGGADQGAGGQYRPDRGLSRALASGRVLADLACAIADGAEGISDFRVIGDQEDLLGPVASVPADRVGLIPPGLAGSSGRF